MRRFGTVLVCAWILWTQYPETPRVADPSDRNLWRWKPLQEFRSAAICERTAAEERRRMTTAVFECWPQGTDPRGR